MHCVCYRYGFLFLCVGLSRISGMGWVGRLGEGSTIVYRVQSTEARREERGYDIGGVAVDRRDGVKV